MPNVELRIFSLLNYERIFAKVLVKNRIGVQAEVQRSSRKQFKWNTAALWSSDGLQLSESEVYWSQDQDGQYM